MPGYDPPVLRAPAVLLVPLMLLALPALGQTVPDGFAVQTLAPGLDTPVAIEFLPDGRVLFAEQITGLVRVFREGAGVQTAPVLAVPGVAAGGERGLLGIAVDPRFPARPYLYVHYTVATPRHIRIARFTLAGDLAGSGDVNLSADPASRYDLIDDIVDVADNHNGGTVRFAVDGLLYASLGEDGSYCRAQDTTANASPRGEAIQLQAITLWFSAAVESSACRKTFRPESRKLRSGVKLSGHPPP